jgi:hypothetical protein
LESPADVSTFLGWKALMLLCCDQLISSATAQVPPSIQSKPLPVVRDIEIVDEVLAAVDVPKACCVEASVHASVHVRAVHAIMHALPMP